VPPQAANNIAADIINKLACLIYFIKCLFSCEDSEKRI